MKHGLEALLSSLQRGPHTAALQIGDGCLDMDGTLDCLRLRAGNARSDRPPSKDRILEAVRSFWETQRLDGRSEVRLLAHGLLQPHVPQGACVIEDKTRFGKVLQIVDQWRREPRFYRRCYRGLVGGYFGFDDKRMPRGTDNWAALRDYLRDNIEHIRVKGEVRNPEWVDVAESNRRLFGERPCADYAKAVLNGDIGLVNRLCEVLSIGQDSWFQRELILEQIAYATELSDEKFTSLLPRLLALLGERLLLRDRGLALILNRYVRVSGTPEHPLLREASVQWWRNPWLPSNATQWGGVERNAKKMVSDWLKGDLIQAFFEVLSEDGTADQRRVQFWKQYIDSISHLEFALGAAARSSQDSDLIALRKKMEGLTCRLDAPGTNNAFVMHLGNLRLVEFSSSGNALYGYDDRRPLPFDTTRPLGLGAYDSNSLKNRQECALWMRHYDGDHGYATWEERFAAELAEHEVHPSRTSVRVSPGRPSPSSATPPTGSHAWPRQFSLEALQQYASVKGLRIENKTMVGGNLWVLWNGATPDVVSMLQRWGFRHKPGRGWWRGE